MNCDSKLRKIFVDDMVATITELVKKHGLEDMVVHREGDPVVIAVRGCIKNINGGNDEQRIELVVQVSPDLKRAEERSLNGSQVVANATADVFRAFDLSDIVASDSVAKAEEINEKKC